MTGHKSHVNEDIASMKRRGREEEKGKEEREGESGGSERGREKRERERGGES